MTGGADPADRPGAATEGRSGAPALRPTGHPRVDAALARATGLAGAPVAEHADLYEAVHADLTAALSAEPETVPAGAVPRPDDPPPEAGDR